MNATLTAALLLGAASSVHCVGMCGPIALAVPSRRTGYAGRLVDAMLLNGGRVLSYVALGLLFGAFGRGLRVAGLQQAISIGLGALILMSLIVPRLSVSLSMPMVWVTAIGRMRTMFARTLSRTSPLGLIISGVMNGLLPCGMVYMALALALSQEGPILGASFMLFFGFGTLPALVLLRLGAASINQRWRASLRRLSPVLMTVVALILVLRGMRADIPYLSPAIDQVPVGVRTCP